MIFCTLLFDLIFNNDAMVSLPCFRLSIDGVIWCDILQDSPLGTNQTVDLYDCVLSSQCLECACYDIETFEKAVRNLSRFAKPGDYVVICTLKQYLRLFIEVIFLV